MTEEKDTQCGPSDDPNWLAHLEFYRIWRWARRGLEWPDGEIVKLEVAKQVRTKCNESRSVAKVL